MFSKNDVSFVLLILIIIAFVIINSYYYLTLYPNVIEKDSFFYFKTAMSISEGNGYIMDARPTIDYPIGYPLFLSVIIIFFGNTPLNIFIVQLVLSILTINVIFNISYRITKSFFFGLIPCVFYIANYKISTFNWLIMSEIYTNFLLITFLFFLFKYHKEKAIYQLIFASITFCLLVLTQPVFQYLLILWIFYLLHILLNPQKNKIGIYMNFIILLLILGPILLRNKKQFGSYKFAFHGGQSFYQGTSLEYDGLWVGMGGRVIKKKNQYIPDRIFSKVVNKDINTTDKIFFKESINNIFKNGLRGIPLYFKNVLRVIVGYPYKKNFNNLNIQQKYYVIFHSVILFFFILGLFKNNTIKKFVNFELIVMTFLISYLVLCYSVSANTPRYGFKILMLIYITAVIPIKELFSSLKEKNVKTI